MTLFDHLNNIHVKKADWDTLTDAEKKTWNVYMVNRYISMLGGMECIVANEVQQYKLDPKVQYEFYKSIFPKQARRATYIKGKSEKQDSGLIDILSQQMEISTREASEYIDLMNVETKSNLLQELGYDAKEIKKLLK
jgi:hypothetical protein